MAAQLWPMFLLAIFNLGIFAPPCDTEELRCQCIQITSKSIPCKLIKTIEVIYENIYCNRMEVIAVLRDGNTICLHPNSTCVRTLINNIPSRPVIPKDYASANNLRGMKFMYSVEFEKLLYLSFMEPQV